MIVSEPLAAIASPCVNTCRIDPVSRHCIGCGRTIDEIARWGSETPQWRAAVMAALPTRRGDRA